MIYKYIGGYIYKYIIYTYACIFVQICTNICKYIQVSKKILLTRKIDCNLFLKINTLKNLICTNIYPCKIVLLLDFYFHWHLSCVNWWVKTIPTFWKRKFIGVQWLVANRFRVLLEFSWVSSGVKNIVLNLLLWEGLWLNYHCLWVVAI